MIFNRIEHLGIAVKDLTKSNLLFEKLLGVRPYKQEQVESEQVITSFFQVGENKVELLATTREDGPIGKFINSRGEGIHHVAFAVKDIREEMNRLRAEGFVLLNDEPKRGADNKWVCFIHPKSTGGVLVELCQDIDSSLEK